jgi:hypothetical protein
MTLQRLALDLMSCFALGFPLLGTTEYPQALFVVAMVSQYWVQQNTHKPLLHLASLKYSHSSPYHPTRQTH